MRIFHSIGQLFGIDWGSFTLKSGEHEVVIPTTIKPRKVSTSLEASDIDGCGQAPINTLAWTAYHDGKQVHGYECKGNDCGLKDGIKFYVNVKSDSVVVQWFAAE